MIFETQTLKVATKIAIGIKALESTTDFPLLMQTVGLALLTILIPLAITVLTGQMQNKNKEIGFSVLDFHVILDRIFRIKFLLFCSAMIFIPPFFWKFTSLRNYVIIFWCFGVYSIVSIIIDFSKWIKGDNLKFRSRYLNSLADEQKKKEVWSSIWQAKEINSSEGKEFFKIFSSKIDKLLIESRTLTIEELLNDFLIFIDKRMIIFLLLNDNVFSKILEWHFKIFKKTEDKTNNIWVEWIGILRIVDLVIKKIEEKSFDERQSFILFDSLNKHCQLHEEKEYPNYLVNLICLTLFEKSDSSIINYDAWSGFPESWKITKDNYTNKPIARASFITFESWLIRRLVGNEEKLDVRLEMVLNNLFPEVDPITWAKLLIFVYSPYDPSNHIKSIIERPWNFGLIGRVGVGYVGISEKEMWEEYGKEQKKLSKNAIELALLIFKNNFSKEKLEKYIRELEILKYDDKILAEMKRSELLKVFKEMLDVLSGNPQ